MGLNDRLIKKLAESISTRNYDNFDWEIRSLACRERCFVAANRILDGLLSLAGFEPMTIVRCSYYWQRIAEFNYLYDVLDDDESKEKLVELLAYRMLGYHKVKLSRNTPELWQMREKARAAATQAKIGVNFGNGHLNRYNLRPFGYDLDLFFVPNGVVIEYALEQYRYGEEVCVRPGDIAIDCGSCWGDTALYFAYKGAAQIYAFEFIPSNLNVLERNRELNPEYGMKIRVVRNPVWSDSGTDLSFTDRGPSSRVGEPGQYAFQAKTLSIDDFVEKEIGGGPVHFIKMDIEGAEIPALNGARNTIAKHKPRLAISVYHKPDDMITIPRLIHEIRRDYRFYLDYYTIVGDEIVLYAV